jgi:dissimilatory sulfite reductase (desulfoviridin) alpha/beta subunit
MELANMTQNEALKLALEALEEYHYGEARIILRQALEQPVQEPVAWEQFHEHLVERNFCPRCGKRTADLTTIHTCTPPQENT